VQLALQGLRQSAGEEAIRVAILGLEDGDNAGETAKRFLRTLLTDPLVDEQPWERELDAYDPTQPLVVRVRPGGHEEGFSTLERRSALNEVHISSAALNGLNLELLLMDTSLAITSPEASSVQAVEEAVLNPVVDIPSAEDRLSPMTTPVHKTLLIANGLSGAVQISSLPPPIVESSDTVMAAANMEGLPQELLDTPFEVVDVALAEKAVALFRQGPQHAMEYERLWFASNMPTLVKWLKADLAATNSAATKPAMRNLIASLLQSTLSSVQAEEARKVSKALAIKNLPEAGELNKALAEWAQSAHAELQGELDLAFTGRRWRKLGWWKLFWRVDDVAMLTNEMLSQRFLPTAEQELVYLTGRIAGPAGEHPTYSQPISSIDGDKGNSTKLGSGEIASVSPTLPKWPGHIAFTRRYLQNETIPALQALAQKLVLQAVGTTSVTTSLAALLYVSSFASSLYEAGAVAALGIVYSLGRMQKKWEAARGFWEGDVREEGRKAVRAVEGSVTDVLQGSKAIEDGSEAAEELQKIRELVAKAEDALARMR
jgi:hypothetical protein